MLISIKCKHCGVEFSRRKSDITRNLKRGRPSFCTSVCHNLFLVETYSTVLPCSQCGIIFTKKTAQLSKSGNNFCTHSCSAKYSNAHKTKGTRRSKLELWAEEKLKELYPKLDLTFNSREAINSELDIYIPSLKLAFELNGIFHYEAIYTELKLDQIQNNDRRKFQACIEQGISLCIIDTSGQKFFRPESSQKYLDIIINILERRMGYDPTTLGLENRSSAN